MSSRRPRPAHQEAVARRLALLSAELAGSATGRRATGAPSDGGSGGTGPRQTRGTPPGLAHRGSCAARGSAGGGRRLRPVAPAPPEDATWAPVVPVPGRHASRRPGACSRRGRCPRRCGAGRARARRQLAVVAVLVAAGAGRDLLGRGGGRRPVVAPVLSGRRPVRWRPGDAGRPVARGSTGPPAPGGASRRPRVGDGRRGREGTPSRHRGPRRGRAGGRRVEGRRGGAPGVDLSGLNLARVLVDGEQIVVGVPAPAGVAAPAATVARGPGAAARQPQHADESELDTLPEVGPVTARAILAWRDRARRLHRGRRAARGRRHRGRDPGQAGALRDGVR